MHENRETSGVFRANRDRSGKAESRTPDVYAPEESDRAVVPMKPPNKEAQASAEVVEGRARTKENIGQSHTPPAQDGRGVSQGLAGVRKAAKERKQERFTTLLHHLTTGLLRHSYYALKRNAAPGVDGVRWQEYEEGLENRLIDLKDRIHRGAYRAQPSRRVYIRKDDGRQRPLGIAALEDKIVQQAVVTILNEIYEVDFRGFSYGFRPGRGPHQALDALNVGIQRKRVNWILDADIRGFFDNMSHEWTMQFVQHRVADKRILRLIQKWLKAGVSEDGEWSETKVGTPQGAVVSPLLANVYLHYVFDLWMEAWRKKVADGEVIVVRYADDLGGGVPGPGGSRAVSRGFSRAPGEVRAGAARREDAADRVRQVRSEQPASARRRRAGKFHVPGVHALLRDQQRGEIHHPTGKRRGSGWRRSCSRSSKRFERACTSRCPRWGNGSGVCSTVSTNTTRCRATGTA